MAHCTELMSGTEAKNKCCRSWPGREKRRGREPGRGRLVQMAQPRQGVDSKREVQVVVLTAETMLHPGPLLQPRDFLLFPQLPAA